MIGGGTAGIVAARTAAELGASALLVERERIGGDCLWTGCVPSKTLLSIAHDVAAVRAGATRAGVPGTDPQVDFAVVREQVAAAVSTIEPDDAPETMREAGVCVVNGTATLTGPDRASVAGVDVRFRAAVLATGSAPVVPPVPGLVEGQRQRQRQRRSEEPVVVTSETVWDLTALPERLLVLGGGSVGCELGQAFARLGSRVTLVERGECLLPGEDPEASAVLADALAADGVEVRTGRTVRAVEAGRAELDDAGSVVADVVLVATGRRPVVDGLGLDAAGVALDADGCVIVDDRLVTSNPRVWAAGDVTAYPRFTHVAGIHASTAASNAVLGLRRRAETLVPRVTYTSPEVASFGPRESQGARTVRHDDVDRAVAEGRTAGFARLHLGRRGRLVGATVVGPRAGEELAELVLAARSGVSVRSLAGTIRAYPTWGYAAGEAALGQVREELARPVVRRSVDLLRALRRRRA